MALDLYHHLSRPGAEGAPLVFAFHGTGGDEHDLLPLADALSPSSAVLSVRGRVLEGTMPRFFARLAEGVFDEEDLRERCEELAAFVAAASQEYGIAPGSLVALGFSNGANTASALMLTHPRLLAGAVLIGAVPPFADPPDTAVFTVGAVLSGAAVLHVQHDEEDGA